MLCLFIKTVVFFASVIGIVIMAKNGEYTCMCFLILALLWPLCALFEENGDEHHHKQPLRNWNEEFSTPYYRQYNKPYFDDAEYRKKEYKNIVKRCKRTLKISIAKKSNDNEII